ncbi:MAG TPA: hypothetical protein VJP87_04670 [Candidatus Acidoferrales bacterium]|nr:hypothetical protein [Candidatus Acidoferrales bacterium]
MPRSIAIRCVLLLLGCGAFFILAASTARTTSHADDAKSAEPWSTSDTVSAEQLHRELADEKSPKPAIVYVGFRTLFAGGHIPGATFHGTASKPDGLEELKKWAGSLPRTADVVIYCGCCPFEKCPNIRPAYTALHEVGFRKLRVLVLPTSFAVDWAGKGYAIEKGI